jgi:hypothetical protein
MLFIALVITESLKMLTKPRLNSTKHQIFVTVTVLALKIQVIFLYSNAFNNICNR